MSQNKEILSSFIDGEEQSSISVFDELAKHPELVQTFERYHAIGDAMRDDLSPAFTLDFASAVSAAIDAEPTIIAPKQTPSVTLSDNKSLSRGKKVADVIPFFGKLGQYGIAASVAAAMVIGVQQLNNNSSLQQDIPVLQTIPTGGYASPVSFQATSSNELQQELKQKQRIEQQRRMNAYVKDHLLQQRLKSQSASDIDK